VATALSALSAARRPSEPGGYITLRALRYGLNDRRAQTHHEIGEWLGVGEERSRQLGLEALHWLRSIAEGTKRAA
jgi:DNA-directed RNA polymerase sigma subunit (sigma70/sigma32)